MHSSLTWMMNNPIADVLFETFTLSLGGEEVELLPGGASRDVTDENKLEYVRLVLDRRLGRTGATAHAVSIMRDGLNEVVPRGLFREFSAEDLALALNGRNTISIDELRPATKYTHALCDHRGTAQQERQREGARGPRTHSRRRLHRAAG